MPVIRRAGTLHALLTVAHGAAVILAILFYSRQPIWLVAAERGGGVFAARRFCKNQRKAIADNRQRKSILERIAISERFATAMASHKRVVWRLSGMEGAKIAADQPTKPTEALTKEEPWPSPIKPWLYPSRRLDQG